MYSGQEIVSQEECKIVLAEFYEGVDCYNETDNTIKFSLQDWATATIEGETLHTHYFDCTPVIITEFDHITIAELPEGTTGLEVVMHTAEYTRTRIMPLMYLPKCNSWEYPTNSVPYIKTACNTPTHTTLVIKGKVDSVTSTSISITGYEAGNILVLEFLDVNEAVMTISPIFTTETRDFIELEYNKDTGQYEEVIVNKEVVLVTLDIAIYIRTSGYYDSQYTLYDCILPNPYGDITEFCLVTYPTAYTRIMADTDEHEAMHDGWYKIGTTEFRLLPNTEFLDKIAQQYRFKIAKQIIFRTPIRDIYDIYLCDDNPIEPFSFNPSLYYKDDWWHLEVDIYGPYRLQNNCIIDLNTNDLYCFYTVQHDYPIDMVELDIKEDCRVYYTTNGIGSTEVSRVGMPISDDPRVVWDDTLCKFVVTCASLGTIPCDTCIDCTDLAESAHLTSVTPTADYVCTSEGEKLAYEGLYACSVAFQAIGAYPSLNIETTILPSPVIAQSEYIFFKGSSMYINVHFPSFSWDTFVGNLDYGVQLSNVLDGSTSETKAVSFIPFLYLSIFKFPFEYVRNGGLDNYMWSDSTVTLPDGVSFAGYSYDFKITREALSSLLEAAWQSNFFWGNACAWLSANIRRSDRTVDKVITVNNTSDVDDLICNDNGRVNYNASNVPLLQTFSGGVRPPVGAYGAYQTKYDAYANDIAFLISKDSEAYAYVYKIYDQSISP